MPRIRRQWIALTLLTLALFMPLTSAAAPPANEAFYRIWERTERPVMEQATSRTWMWGPSASTGSISEPYIEAPDGYREVQYFDKTRMEINNPAADPDSLWFVTNGLLAKEMITGRVQIGHLTYVETEPARSQIAGDLHPTSPTYLTLSHLIDDPPRQVGEVLTEQLAVDGNSYALNHVPELAEYGIVAGYYVPETDQTIAEPFWAFMTSSGLVREGGANVHGRLFEDPFFATGFPITEAYWVYVPVGGDFKDVLLQCFERRCLTYTPDNPTGWQVEAGNIGQHYHQFRYGRSPEIIDCIDLNLATLGDLTQITNIGEARARAIMAERPFEAVEELERVSGIGPITVEQILDQGLACVAYDINTSKDFHHFR